MVSAIKIGNLIFIYIYIHGYIYYFLLLFSFLDFQWSVRYPSANFRIPCLGKRSRKTRTDSFCYVDLYHCHIRLSFKLSDPSIFVSEIFSIFSSIWRGIASSALLEALGTIISVTLGVSFVAVAGVLRLDHTVAIIPAKGRENVRDRKRFRKGGKMFCRSL